MTKNNNFAVIDIGTNSVKCICFANGNTIDLDKDNRLRNKKLTQRNNENINKHELLKYITEYMVTLKDYDINQSKVYIVATEALRKSSNKGQIIQFIQNNIKRSIHIISPKREAYLSALGGLSYIQNHFKERPDKVLYIEAGGGSTEVSLLDTNKRSFLSMLATASVPLGSKSNLQNNVLSQYDNDISAVTSLIEPKDKVAVVVNSSAAGRILARANNEKKYMPDFVARKQYGLTTSDFLSTLGEITSTPSHKVQEKFYLGKNHPQGFINHCEILQHILQKSPRNVQTATLSSTIGGVKLGLEKEIKKADGNEQKIKEILEKDEMTIGDKPLPLPDNENNNKTWRTRLKKTINDINKDANQEFCFVEEPDNNDTKNKIMTFTDKNNPDNKMQFSSLDSARVSGDIQAYYAICMVAQKLKKKVSFGSFKTIEQKSLLYQACLEKGVEMSPPPQPHEFKDCKNFAHIQTLLSKPQKTNNSLMLAKAKSNCL